MALIAAMTWICILGTELSARIQIVLMAIQIGALLLFVGVVLVKVWSGDGPPIAIDPSLSWFNPFEISSGGALTGRPAARRLHLLGLGERRQPQRGDRELGHRTRPRRPPHRR